MEKSARQNEPIRIPAAAGPRRGPDLKSASLLNEKLQVWREQSLNQLLPLLAILSLPVTLAVLFSDYSKHTYANTPYALASAAVLFAIAYLRKLSYPIKIWALLILMFALGVYLSITSGNGDGKLLLVSFSALSMIFLGWRYGLITAALSILTLLVISFYRAAGDMAVLSSLVSSAAVVLMVNILLITALKHFLAGLDEALLYATEVKQEIENRIEDEIDQRLAFQTTVQNYVEFMGRVIKGDLSSRVQLVDGGTEIDNPLNTLGRQLNDTLDSLQNMIQQIHEASSNLTSATAEILSATTQQAAGASEQSAAISQTTSTVEEIKTISEQFIHRSQEVTATAQHSADVSRSGEQVISDTISSMAHIKAQVNSIAENILALSERTQQIGEIISTVNDIASQSNILALNAAVEAARAGEQGKGFAVVAEEVRNLAEQSRQATAQVRAILIDIQRAINTTVMVTEEGTKVVEQGVVQTEQAGKVIQQLAIVIDKSSLQAVQMAAAGQQQTTGIEQIASAMQSIKLATMQGLASTRQTEKTAQDLNSLAKELSAVVAQYQA